MKTVTVGPGKLGISVAITYVRVPVAVVKAISPSCKCKSEFAVGDHILTVNGRRVTKIDDLSVGSDSVRRLGVHSVRGTAAAAAAGTAAATDPTTDSRQHAVASTGERKRDEDVDAGSSVGNETVGDGAEDAAPASEGMIRRTSGRKRKVVSYKHCGEGYSDSTTSDDEEDFAIKRGRGGNPLFDIEESASVCQLNRHMRYVEEIMTAKNNEMQRVRKRLEYLTTRCSVEGCNNLARETGVCVKHGGKKPAKKPKLCSVEGCTSFAKVKGGLCRRHCVDKPASYYCKIEGCRKKSQLRGLCARHGAPIPRCNAEGCSSYAKKGGYCVACSNRAQFP